MALAALKDRQMLPDGSLIPWKSPNGTPMSLAAAAPEVPWTDLSYSLTPNGSTLDYVADAPYSGRARDLQAVVRRRPLPGRLLARRDLRAAPAADPEADLTAW